MDKNKNPPKLVGPSKFKLSEEALDIIKAITEEEARDAGFQSEKEYYAFLDEKTLAEENKERIKLKLTLEAYNRWSHPGPDETTILINGIIPALEKEGKIIKLREDEYESTPEHSYCEACQESPCMCSDPY